MCRHRLLAGEYYMSKMQFDFGENWTEFSTTAITPDRIARARSDFRMLFSSISPNVENLTFLDIGFGQGIALMMASELFKRVIGCDINAKCSDALNLTQKHFPNLALEPEVFIGSILDRSFADTIVACNGGKFGVVHAWGVLHHTGDMWKAIEIAADMVDSAGYLVLAIYNRHWSSHIWKSVKYLYVNAPRAIQRPMVWGLYWLKRLAGYEKGSDYRGMDFYYDIVDWIGGYPYEFASKKEVLAKIEPLGFKLVKYIPTRGMTGCNEYVFVKQKALQ